MRHQDQVEYYSVAAVQIVTTKWILDVIELDSVFKSPNLRLLQFDVRPAVGVCAARSNHSILERFQ